MSENFITAFIKYFVVIGPIGNSTLDAHLSDLEKHQEWKVYLESKKRKRKSTGKPDTKNSVVKKPV
jgi:hypothetical protein